MSSPLNVRLEQYEGPLDLLLDLIRKQQINIQDIPIARITQQYLDYMQAALELDMELGAEFIYMAATLIHIKSRTLLPHDPELTKFEADEDPRAELVTRLLEHQRFKNAAEMLRERRLVEEAIWSNPKIQEFLQDEGAQGLNVSLFDLVKTLQKVIDRGKTRPVFEISKEEVSVSSLILFLAEILESPSSGGQISALEFFERQPSRRAMICAFLAILELVKHQGIELAQEESFGEILLKRTSRLRDAVSSSGTLTAVQEDYH